MVSRKGINYYISQYMLPGLYAIVHLPTEKIYLGSSTDCERRLRTHRNLLRRGRHDNVHLQRAWDRGPEASFRFYSLRSVPISELRIAEAAMLALWPVAERYNLSPVVHTGSMGSNSRLSEHQVRTIVSRARSGELNKALATEYGVCTHTIWRILKGSTWQGLAMDRLSTDRRSGKGRAKLNYQSAAVVRERLARGETATALAAEYGVSVGAISHISTGRSFVSHPSRQF